MGDKMVTISEEEYDKLREDQFRLECLQDAGVDNWDGYAIALEYFNANKE